MFKRFNLSYLAKLIWEQGFPIEEVKLPIRHDIIQENLLIQRGYNLSQIASANSTYQNP